MKCSVCIATSVDGYIATTDGGVEWLETAGDPDADMGADPHMGLVEFMDSIDCMVMGRKTMEKLSSFELTPEQWPYGDLRIFVLSQTVAA
ncbi:MAG: dihydrofolate reductase, partial [Acidobacteriota bacterium]